MFDQILEKDFMRHNQISRLSPCHQHLLHLIMSLGFLPPHFDYLICYISSSLQEQMENFSASRPLLIKSLSCTV